MSDPRDDDGDPPKGRSTLVGASFFGPAARAVSVGQEETKWCWAASAQMLRRCVELEEKKQCEIAARRLSKACCTERMNCNIALPLDEIEQLLAENQMTSVRERAQLREAQFWDELFAKRPLLLVDLEAGSTEGHARVVFGWQKLRNGRLVARVADPAKAKKASVPFERLTESAWRETWHRIEVTT